MAQGVWVHGGHGHRGRPYCAFAASISEQASPYPGPHCSSRRAAQDGGLARGDLVVPYAYI